MGAAREALLDSWLAILFARRENAKYVNNEMPQFKELNLHNVKINQIVLLRRPSQRSSLVLHKAASWARKLHHRLCADHLHACFLPSN
mmetsp:Transcript_40370/g.160314  ORF Transcript_40370/g.160314 Transcript_40370/m.160314 type:complete len:88 (-) Transcript_40370:2038-2301(-)